MSRMTESDYFHTKLSNGSQTWTQVFGYDRFGNRNTTSGLGVTNFSFSGNRITAHSYDSAGNTLNFNDGTGRTFTYRPVSEGLLLEQIEH